MSRAGHAGDQPRTKLLVRRPGEAAENLQFVVTPNDFARPEWQLHIDGATAGALELLGAHAAAQDEGPC